MKSFIFYLIESGVYTAFLDSRQLDTLSRALIIRHEEAHIRQKHWIDLLLCQAFAAFQWFNPLAWKYLSCIKENHEFMADKEVLNKEVSPLTYKKLLINQSFRHPVFLLSNTLNYSPKKRFTMMSKEKSPEWKKALVLALLPLFSLVLWASAEPRYVESEQASPADSLQVLKEKPLIIIGGKASPGINPSSINPDSIQSITVVKGKEASDQYGEDGKNGVIDITMKKGAETTVDKPSVKSTPNPQVLLMINGEEYPSLNPGMIDPSYIESMEVWKDEAAIKKFGEKGKNGVMNITLKKDFDYSSLEKAKEKQKTGMPDEILYIVDGKKVPKVFVEILPPDRIKSISVLKDKSAASIYGDEGKNGVIVITTLP